MAPSKAPAKWEDEEESSSDESEPAQPVVAPRRKFEDEEDSDDVADNWEEEEDSEVEREKAVKAAAAKAKADAEAAANKKSKAQRIEEQREARRKKALEDEDETDSEDEDDASKRARLRATEQEADLKHAQALFEDVGLGAKKSAGPNKAFIIEDKANPGQAIDLSSMPLFKPTTKTQFDALATTLGPLLSASSAKPHYSLWVQNFVKQICAEMPSAEIKKAASGLTALCNEKMKEEKERDKTGKKSKAQKTKTSAVISRSAVDTTSYDDGGLGDDDFM